MMESRGRHTVSVKDRHTLEDLCLHINPILSYIGESKGDWLEDVHTG